MKLRRFNDDGVEQFRSYLATLKIDPTAPLPEGLLTNPSLTEPMDGPLEAEPRTFLNRLDFARWLQDAADSVGARVSLLDTGFWSWLSLLLFDQVCPISKGGRRVRDEVRYIPRFSDWKRRYRHHLATSYSIFYAHRDNPDRALLLLSGSLDILGEMTEQIASRQELVSCPGTMGLATLLFFDSAAGKLKRGASGDAAARLGVILNQYTRTYDIAVMQPSDSLRLLPKEFDRFRNAS